MFHARRGVNPLTILSCCILWNPLVITQKAALGGGAETVLLGRVTIDPSHPLEMAPHTHPDSSYLLLSLNFNFILSPDCFLHLNLHKSYPFKTQTWSPGISFSMLNVPLHSPAKLPQSGVTHHTGSPLSLFNHLQSGFSPTPLSCLPPPPFFGQG